VILNEMEYGLSKAPVPMSLKPSIIFLRQRV